MAGIDEISAKFGLLCVNGKKPNGVKHLKGLQFQKVLSFINSNKGWKSQFAQDPEEILESFLATNDAKLDECNYGAVMMIGIFAEHWNEKLVADENTKPSDSFFHITKIEDEVVDFAYTLPMEGFPITPSIGALIEFSTLRGEKFRLMVDDILDEKLILKKAMRKSRIPHLPRGKIALEKVYFLPNAYCLEMMLRAITMVQPHHLKILFPGEESLSADTCVIGKAENLTYFDDCLNSEQKDAVVRVVEYSSPHPFILFGPPGTGKSKTVCEAIKQVWLRYPNSFIIVTAPSNCAVDLLSKELIKIIPYDQLVRFVSNARAKDIDPKLSKVTTNCTTSVVAKSQKLRVVCGTLQILGKLVNQLRKKASHIFVDEAGQSTEPETLIALTGFLGIQGQLILAGDPFQLGPVVMTKEAQALGLEKSLMARLMGRKLYMKNENGNFSSKFIIQLVRNYRSHPDLLTVPNRLFYSGTLIPALTAQHVSSLGSFKGLPNKGFPLLFHAVHGSQVKRGKETSMMNLAEAKLVVKYVKKLLADGFRKSDVGIISPYNRQVTLIREKLVNMRLVSKQRLGQKAGNEIVVGSVDKFQGDEREAIVLSTVRSKGLGFLTSSARFNVAITRAKRVLIVIGDDRTLENDGKWKALIDHAKTNRSFISAC